MGSKVLETINDFDIGNRQITKARFHWSDLKTFEKKANMNIEEFRKYCIRKKGVTEELPFDEHTLVFKVMGKMFALTGLQRLPPQVNLKCDPERAIELREEYDGDIFPGYHMSKIHWNTLVILNLPPQLLAELVDHSYELVVAKMTKKLRAELENLD